MNWTTHLLPEIAELSLGKMLDQRKNRGVLRPHLSNINVRWGEFDLTNLRQMRFENHELERFGLQHGDIVMCEGGEPGRCAILLEEESDLMIQKALHRIRAHPGVHPHFLFYSLFFQGRMGLFSRFFTGATILHLPAAQLAQVEVQLPPLKEQRRIAGILSAYDELIANNQRRLAVLEEMARALYREWFVYFRAPGVVMKEGDELPEGWEVKSLGDIMENFDRKRRPLSKMVRSEMQGEYPYYGAAKVFDYVNDFIFDGEYLLLAEDGSVINPDRSPVLQLVNEKFWPNNHTHILRGKSPVSTHFLYLALLDVDVSPYITGAAQPKITQENMNRIPVISATHDVHEAFDRIVEPMIHQCQSLVRKTANLRLTRDLLLPRLMSGRVEVGALEEELT